jgi:hypothetical protein
MALPAVGILRDGHPLAERLVRGIGQLGIHGDRDIRDDVAEQPFADPLTAMDGVVVKAGGMRDKPGGLGQDAGPFGRWEFDRLLRREVRQVIRGEEILVRLLRGFVFEFLRVGGFFPFIFGNRFVSFLFRLGGVFVNDEALVRGE